MFPWSLNQLRSFGHVAAWGPGILEIGGPKVTSGCQKGDAVSQQKSSSKQLLEGLWL